MTMKTALCRMEYDARQADPTRRNDSPKADGPQTASLSNSSTRTRQSRAPAPISTRRIPSARYGTRGADNTELGQHAARTAWPPRPSPAASEFKISQRSRLRTRPLREPRRGVACSTQRWKRSGLVPVARIAMCRAPRRVVPGVGAFETFLPCAFGVHVRRPGASMSAVSVASERFPPRPGGHRGGGLREPASAALASTATSTLATIEAERPSRYAGRVRTWARPPLGYQA
jgi:hypothetical protein